MADDLNVSVALAALFDAVREINALCDADKVSCKDAQEVLDTLARIDTVLHIIPLAPSEENIPEELLTALSNRQEARAQKDWAAADRFRDLILSKGYIIDDTPFGARLKKRR